MCVAVRTPTLNDGKWRGNFQVYNMKMTYDISISFCVAQADYPGPASNLNSRKPFDALGFRDNSIYHRLIRVRTQGRKWFFTRIIKLRPFH